MAASVTVDTAVTPYWEMRGTSVRAVEAELARLWHQATSDGRG